MKKLLTLLATSSCMFSPFTTVSISNAPDSTHIPSYSAPGPLYKKLQGTIWKRQATLNSNYYLFFDRVENKYGVLLLSVGQRPTRYPADSEYIKFSIHHTTSANQEVLGHDNLGPGGIPEYFGIALKSTGLGLQTTSGSDINTINAILTAQTGTEWQLYQR